MTDATPRCVVEGCDFNPEHNKTTPDIDDTLKFYSFPTKATMVRPADRFQRVKWIEFVRISKGLDPKAHDSWNPSPEDKICNNHFVRKYRSDNPSKSNFAPSIFPKCLLNVPPQIIYDLRDLVCWWIKDGEKTFTTLLPIVECFPLPQNSKQPPTKPEQQNRNIKSFTLVEIDVNTEPHPFVKTYIRVNPDLSFSCCLKNKPVPVHWVLGEKEKTYVLGSVYEFQCALERLMKLNLCVGISTSGLKNIPPQINGEIVKTFVDGKEMERLVSNDCEVVAGIKVCGECKKLWNSVYREKKQMLKEQKIKEKMAVENPLSVEERLERCERIIENYKLEVCKLLGQNKDLKDKVQAFKKGKKRNREGCDEVGSGGQREGGVDSGVNVMNEVVMMDSSKKIRTEASVAGTTAEQPVIIDSASSSPTLLSPSASPAPTVPRILKRVVQVQKPIQTVPPPPKQPVLIPPTVVPTTVSQLVQVKPKTIHPPPSPPTTIRAPAPSTSAPKPIVQSPTPQNPQQKVLKITREQALLLRKMTATNASGNVIRVQASQLASINKILGRTSAPVIVSGASAPTTQPTANPVTSQAQKTQQTVVNRKPDEDVGSDNTEGKEPAKKVVVTIIKK